MKGWWISRWVVVAVTFLAAVLRFVHLGSRGFWFDECFTYVVTLAPLRNSLDALLLAGIYSPLYFLLLRPVSVLMGTSEYAFRFLSAAFGLLAVPLIYHFGSHWAGKRVGVTAAIFVAICPFHVWYSQDARMYTLLFFFGLATMDSFVLFLRGRCKWYLFAFCCGVAYLVHYAAFSLLYVQLFYLLAYLKQRWLVRRWFWAQVVALVPLIPWLAWYIVRGVRPAGLSWIPHPSLLAPVYTLWNFTTADVTTIVPPIGVLVIGAVLVFVAGLIRWGKTRRLLALWLGFPIGFLFLLSLKRPYYVDRYLMASLPAYLLLLALGVVAWRNLGPRLLAMVVIVVSMLWGTIRIIGSDLYFAKEDWRGVAATIDAQLEPGDVVVFQDDEALIGTSVYRAGEWPHLVLGTSDASELLQGALTQHQRVWLVWRSPRESNHRLSKSAPFDVFEETTPPVRAWLGTHRGQVTLDLQLPGLSLVRLDAN